MTLKANALEIIDPWILAHVQSKSKHTTVLPGTTNLKMLLKKEYSFLMVIYGMGDWERLDTAEDLKLYTDHFHDATNQHHCMNSASQN